MAMQQHQNYKLVQFLEFTVLSTVKAIPPFKRRPCHSKPRIARQKTIPNSHSNKDLCPFPCKRQLGQAAGPVIPRLFYLQVNTQTRPLAL